MANFISISGPSTTGKSSIVDALSTYPELSNAIFVPAMNDKVWSDLVSQNIFSEFTEVDTDSEYLCAYIFKMIEYYNDCIKTYQDTDKLVVLDGCWIDLSIYSILNLWYMRAIKPLQEEILAETAKYDEEISRIYVTKAEDDKFPVAKYYIRGKISSFRKNRPLEMRYYDIAKHLKNSTPLPSSSTTESSMFILDDLKKLGYVR